MENFRVNLTLDVGNNQHPQQVRTQSWCNLLFRVNGLGVISIHAIA
ncbi:hypothetical protein [Laspinema palackyanum]|nr:hypothetical protein [Laspinema sp. D2c]